MVSRTSTSWIGLVELPQRSVAVHLRTSVYSSSQLPSKRVSLVVSVGAGSQLSLAVTPLGNGGTASHSTVTPGGTPDSTGMVPSITFTTCVALVALPQRSAAVHVRVSV